jgi:hypothetical protein
MIPLLRRDLAGRGHPEGGLRRAEMLFGYRIDANGLWKAHQPQRCEIAQVFRGTL